MTLVFGGLTGLLLGLAIQAAGLTDARRFKDMMALRDFSMLKMALSFLGFGTLMTAFLGWLAVLDVDLLAVRPLDGATLLGGVLAGAAIWLCGLLPGTALGGVGGGRFWESLCAVAGCFVGAMALPWVTGWAQPLRAMTWLQATVFRVTLDSPYLLPGGFLGLGILGLVLLALSGYVPMPQAAREEPTLHHEPSGEPETAAEETVVAALPNEEPLVVDTVEPVLNEDEIIAQEEIPEELPEELDGDPEDVEEPVMLDHPDLDPEPEDEDMTEALVDMEERAGIGTYVSEEAMPVNARVLVKPDAEEIGAVEEEKEASREPVGKA